MDLSLLRHAYERRKIAGVFSITLDQNPVDALAKAHFTCGLKDLLDNNCVTQLLSGAWSIDLRKCHNNLQNLATHIFYFFVLISKRFSVALHVF